MTIFQVTGLQLRDKEIRPPCQKGATMNVHELINALAKYYDDTPIPVVIFKDDEQFEIKSISVERADGENQSAVVIQI